MNFCSFAVCTALVCGALPAVISVTEITADRASRFAAPQPQLVAQLAGWAEAERSPGRGFGSIAVPLLEPH